METIFIHRRKDRFSIIPNDILEDAHISWRAKGILAYLLGKKDGWILMVKDLCNKNSSDGECAIRTSLKELRERGYVSLTKERREKGYVHWAWRVSDIPEFSPNSGYPNSDAPNLDSRHVSNTKVSNDESNKIEKTQTLATPVSGFPNLIYECYPKKSARPKAVKAIQKALCSIEPEKLLNTTKLYAAMWDGASHHELRYCPMPFTWFSEERYNDEPSTWKSPSVKHISQDEVANEKF